MIDVGPIIKDKISDNNRAMYHEVDQCSDLAIMIVDGASREISDSIVWRVYLSIYFVFDPSANVLRR